MKRNYLVLFAAAALLLLAFNAQLPISDPVESNYALTAKEMVESGDWLSPQIYGRYWFDKPIFFYWLTAISYTLFGFTDFASRLAPAVFGLSALGFIAWFAGKIYDKQVGFLSAVILASSTSFFLIGKAIITDATLFLFFSICTACFYFGYTRDARYYYGTYAASALATLTKGPIGFLLPGLIFVLFLICKRDLAQLKRLKLFSGTLLFLLLAAPWYLAMYQTHGTAFTDVFLGTHNFLRATRSEHPKDDVFYYYTAVLLLGFFPWAAYLPKMLWTQLQKLRKMLHTPELFLYIWAFSVIIFFQLMATKYATYTYPALFPLSILMAKYLADHKQAVLSKGSLAFNALFAGAFYFAYRAVGRNPNIELPSPFLLLTAIFIFIAVSVYSATSSHKPHNRQFAKITGSIALCTLLLYLALSYTIAVPLVAIRTGKPLAPIINASPPTTTVAVVNEYSASAVFYTGRTIYRLQEPPVSTDKFSWNFKNVMPYMSPHQAPSELLLLARDREFYSVPPAIAARSTLLTKIKRWSIYHIK